MISCLCNVGTTPFCTPNRHFFISFRHIAIDFVTISLGLNRGSHYELVHTCLTKRTTVWHGSYNRKRAFNFGRGFSIVKVECPLSINGCPLIIWTKFELVYLPYFSVDLHQTFNTDALGHWEQNAIQWTMGIVPLRFAGRTRRPTPLIMVSGTSWAILFRTMAIIRFICASEDATQPPR